MTQLYLFVMNTCGPCHRVMVQLRRVPNWEKYVTVVYISPRDHTSLPLKQKYGVRGTPTLIAELKDGTVHRFTKGEDMTKGFFIKLFKKLESELT